MNNVEQSAAIGWRPDGGRVDGDGIIIVVKGPGSHGSKSDREYLAQLRSYAASLLKEVKRLQGVASK